MKTTEESLISCMTTQLVQVSGLTFTEFDAGVQEAFVNVFDDAMTDSMRLLEQRIRGFGPDVVVRWGNPGLPGQLRIRRGRLEWVEG
jgi:hypothetical protein